MMSEITFNKSALPGVIGGTLGAVVTGAMWGLQAGIIFWVGSLIGSIRYEKR